MLFKKKVAVFVCFVSFIVLLALLFFLAKTQRNVIAAPNLVSLQVATSADDAHQRTNIANGDSTAYRVRIGTAGTAGKYFAGGFRFAGVNIPEGSVIEKAFLKCYVDSVNWDDPETDIFAEASDNAVDFVADPNITARPKTAALATWQAVDIGVGWKTSVDLKAVIQEVVNRPGWVSGNSLALLAIGKSDSRDFRCLAYDKSASKAATLEITYREILPDRPNIIVIETDDQRADTLSDMSAVMSRLVGEGMNFTNSFVTTSLCCPSRSSFLSGLYAHNHNVWFNKPPNGGVESFNDSSTLATWLQAGGYTTSFIGKYLNGYNQISPYIPPGWSDWHASIGGYDGKFNDNGVIHNYNEYSTDVMRNLSLNLIQSGKRPFFLWLTPYAPHGEGPYPQPARVAPRHEGTCDTLSPYRPPSFNEADVSDKPAFVQATPLLDEAQTYDLDTFRKSQICSLKAVDEAIAAIIEALGPELDNTVIIFTSDNGFMWGEHRLIGKVKSYEESSRVPLVIRYPRLVGTSATSNQLVLNIDLAPTIAELAGITPLAAVNGKSLVSLLLDPNASWRSDFLIEHNKRNFGVGTSQYKYVELGTGEKEFYDLVVDPFELENQINNPTYAALIAQLAARLAILKQE